IFGQDATFEAVVLNRTSGEGVLRASSHVDCENQKEYTFIIQAYDCGAGPSGANWKKSHKLAMGSDGGGHYALFFFICIWMNGQQDLRPVIVDA
ncbi:Calsyntenin-2, partial [Goodea atripinnis]